MDVKLILHGNIVSEYYAQTLCLMVFPRAKFKEELSGEHIPSVELSEYEENGIFYASAKITTENGVFESDFSEKRKEKFYMETSASVMGRAFFQAAEKCGMKKKPWGLLTGVRPAKPLLCAKLAGKDLDCATSQMVDSFLVFPEKAKLCKEVAESEYIQVKDIKQGCVSIYISVPFCPTRCAYCSFVSYALPNLMALIPEYCEHICSDIRKVAKSLNKKNIEVTSVYVGGGTPTTFSDDELEKLCKALTESFDLQGKEFCVEAGRPDTITEEKLAILKKYGVNRISINPQTLHDNTLEKIGRRHTVEDFRNAYKLAQGYDFYTKNVDLILGLPGESGEDFIESVSGIIALSPENITLHSFCIKKAADLASDPFSLSGDDLLAYQEKAIDMLYNSGYSPYYIYRQKNAVGDLENIGFSKKGHECFYNIAMMEEIQTVIGIGAGASTRAVNRDGSFIDRHYAPKYPFEYKDYKIEDTISFIDDFYTNKF